jgi:hypothetical protein
VNIIESTFRQACPDLTELQLTIISSHAFWGYHVELRESTRPMDLVTSGWYSYISGDDYMVILPRSDAIDPRGQAAKLEAADVPSYSVVYVVPVKRGAHTTREARALCELRQDFLLHADFHYSDCAKDVFVFWHRKELAQRLLEVVERQLQSCDTR